MTRHLRWMAGLLSVLALVVPTASVARAQPRSAEQIVFSGTGTGTFNGRSGPLGFWIWCEDEEAGNPYAGRCNGSLYVYALHLVKHVTGTVSEPSEDVYRMTVSSRGGEISCTLTNTAPIQRGPHNTVTATCTSPSGTGTSTTAVVNATGP